MKQTLTILAIIIIGTFPVIQQSNIELEVIINALVNSLKYYPVAILLSGVFLLGLVVKLSLINKK